MEQIEQNDTIGMEDENEPKQPTHSIRLIQKTEYYITTTIELNCTETEFMIKTGSLVTILPESPAKTLNLMPLTKLTTKNYNVKKKRNKNRRWKNNESKRRWCRKNTVNQINLWRFHTVIRFKRVRLAKFALRINQNTSLKTMDDSTHGIRKEVYKIPQAPSR